MIIPRVIQKSCYAKEALEVLSQALAASKRIHLNKLIDADGVKNCGLPTLAKPISESRAVYISVN